MSVRPTLVILCGLPFSGKSTLARLLVAQFGWTHVALDEVMGTLGLWQQASISQVQWDHAHQTAYQQVYALVRNGCSVVYDATNHTRQQRDELRQGVAALDVCVCCVPVTTPIETVRQRVQANRQLPQRGDVSDEELEYVVTHYEPPLDDELVVPYTLSTPLATWIEHFQRVCS